MRKAFTGLAGLLMLAVVAEFYFAAAGAAEPGLYRPHHVLGYVIFLLPLVMALVAALGGLPRRLIGLALLVVGLTSLQVVIAKAARALGDGGGLVFGLHAVSGLAIPLVAWLILRQARALPDPATAEPAAG
ncbi:DUF6220 domain-containing protein [Catellatospora bangladeshensis]|uniref:Uncharacterized protein n=1 Tax=Catellatospora bangladeshensis TaxID=310355 RepID=A0A8J3NM75_9ACTN|nr:DUF6220 domain-containing protein [Catellatospora bangladeshensis]GIF84896.1 hypothetical protein Cba03nite_62450 [Catellatospora bangladeshensis]